MFFASVTSELLDKLKAYSAIKVYVAVATGDHKRNGNKSGLPRR
jgi:hypothetical protein